MHIAHYEDGKFLTVEQIAKMTGLKRRQLANLAKKKMIPGVTRPNGYHYAYPLTPELWDWIQWKGHRVKQRKVDGRSGLHGSRRIDTGINSIQGVRGEFDIWRRRVESKLDAWDDETIEEVRRELAAFVHMHSCLTQKLKARKLKR